MTGTGTVTRGQGWGQGEPGGGRGAVRRGLLGRLLDTHIETEETQAYAVCSQPIVAWCWMGRQRAIILGGCFIPSRKPPGAAGLRTLLMDALTRSVATTKAGSGRQSHVWFRFPGQSALF